MKVLIVSDTHGREQNLAEALEQTLRRVLREELRTVSIHQPAGEETVPGQMLDFLAGL